MTRTELFHSCRSGNISVQNISGRSTSGIGRSQSGVTLDIHNCRSLSGQTLSPPIKLRIISRLRAHHRHNRRQRSITVRIKLEDLFPPIFRSLVSYPVIVASHSKKTHFNSPYRSNFVVSLSSRYYSDSGAEGFVKHLPVDNSDSSYAPQTVDSTRTE